jgi:hypothetical protein
MTARAAWKRRLNHATAADLDKARSAYQALVDVYTRSPGLGSPGMHENAVTALREIEVAMRRIGR